jgi:hypothetical protein
MNNFTGKTGRPDWDLWESAASAAPGNVDSGFTLFIYGALLYNEQ